MSSADTSLLGDEGLVSLSAQALALPGRLPVAPGTGTTLAAPASLAAELPGRLAAELPGRLAAELPGRLAAVAAVAGLDPVCVVFICFVCDMILAGLFVLFLVVGNVIILLKH